MNTKFYKVATVIVVGTIVALGFQNCAKLSIETLSTDTNLNSSLSTPEPSNDEEGVKILIETHLPLLTINPSGGASFVNHIIMLDKEKNWLETYDRMGLGTKDDVIDNSVKAIGALWSKNSSMLSGIQAKLSLDDQSHVRAYAIAVPSNDNTSSNRLDISQAVMNYVEAGKIGKFVNPRGDATGISMSSGSFSYSMSNIVSTQARLVEFPQQFPGIDYADPFADLETSLIFSFGSTTPRGSGDADLAFYLLNMFNKNFALASQSRGGYDYLDHTNGNGREMQISKDRELGLMIGKSIKLALVKKRPLFIAMLTDGSTAAPQGSSAGAPLVTDRGQQGIVMFFVVDPNSVISTANQSEDYLIGGFHPFGLYSDTDYLSTLIASEYNTDNIAKIGASILLANYLNAAGKDDKIKEATDGYIDITSTTVLRTPKIIKK